MTAKLDKTLKREIIIDGEPYTVALSPEGIKLTRKGFRKGQEISWKSLLSADGSGTGREEKTGTSEPPPTLGRI